MSQVIKSLYDYWQQYLDGQISKEEYRGIKAMFEEDEALCRSFEDKHNRPTNNVVAPPSIENLNEQQLEAFRALTQYLFNPSDLNAFLLEGYAGTGKTYTISMVVTAYLHHYNNVNIAVTAPVNKAVKVLRSAALNPSDSISYITVHSLLGLKPQVSHSGEIEYVRDATQPQKIDDKHLLILDEVSMLNDELFELIYKHVQLTGLKVIFLGDGAQIPPVKSKGHLGGSDSIPLTAKGREEYKIGRVVLTDIVRQKGGSPIIELATTIRNAPLYRDELDGTNYLNSKQLEDGEGLNISSEGKIEITVEQGVIFAPMSDKDFMRGILKQWFTSLDFTANADFAKVIAWTNKTVDTFNVIIRKMLFGNKAANIEIGEKLLADQPIFDIESLDKRIIFTTNDEFVVMGYEIKEQNVNGVMLKYYYALVEHDNGTKKIKERIRIIHEDSYQAYAELLGSIREQAIENTKEKKGLPYWKTFYAVQENFAAVKYNYAITAHKSQGSTYTNVMVVESDINANSNIRERNRIKYTAVSRPSKLLIIAQ